MSLPSGTVTFLFTDIEGSTKLWEQHPEAIKPALAKHDSLLKEAIESNNGHIIKTTGDGVHAVFTTALDGINASIAAQRQFQTSEFFKNSEVSQAFTDLNEALNYALEGGYRIYEADIRVALGLPCKWRKRKSTRIRPARAANDSRDGLSLGEGGREGSVGEYREYREYVN